MSENKPAKGTWGSTVKSFGIAIAAVLALIQIYEWIRTPSQKVVAEVTFGSFLLPPDIKAEFDEMESLSDEKVINKELDSDNLLKGFNSPQGQEVRRLLIRKFSNIIQVYSARSRAMRNYEIMGSNICVVKVRNVGSKSLSAVTLTLPKFNSAVIKRPGEEIKNLKSGEIIRLGILQPKEEVTLTSWSSLSSPLLFEHSYRITHDSGVGDVVFQVPTGGVGQWVDKYWFPTLMVLMLLAALTLLLYMESKGKNVNRSKDSQEQELP